MKNLNKWSNNILCCLCLLVAALSSIADPLYLEAVSVQLGRSFIESPDIDSGLGFANFPFTAVGTSEDTLTSQMITISEEYSENQLGFIVDVGIGKDYVSELSLLVSSGEFDSFFTYEPEELEILNIFSVSTGNYIGAIALEDQTLSSDLQYNVSSIVTGIRIKKLVGSSYFGLDYKYLQTNYELNINQNNNDGFFHTRDEEIDSQTNRLGFVVGHELELTGTWSVSMDIDLGLENSSDDYKVRQVGRLSPPSYAFFGITEDIYSASEDRTFFSPRITIESHHKIGNFKLSPYLLVTSREVTEIEYFRPPGGSNVEEPVNRPSRLGDMRQTAFSGGITIKLNY